MLPRVQSANLLSDETLQLVLVCGCGRPPHSTCALLPSMVFVTVDRQLLAVHPLPLLYVYFQ